MGIKYSGSQSLRISNLIGNESKIYSIIENIFEHRVYQ